MSTSASLGATAAIRSTPSSPSAATSTLQPSCLEQAGHQLADVGIVLDEHDATSRSRRAGGRRITPSWVGSVPTRQPDDELAASAEARADDARLAAVQAHEPVDERQADAHAAFGAVEAAVGLREQLEHARQHRRARCRCPDRGRGSRTRRRLA